MTDSTAQRQYHFQVYYYYPNKGIQNRRVANPASAALDYGCQQQLRVELGADYASRHPLTAAISPDEHNDDAPLDRTFHRFKDLPTELKLDIIDNHCRFRRTRGLLGITHRYYSALFIELLQVSKEMRDLVWLLHYKKGVILSCYRLNGRRVLDAPRATAARYIRHIELRINVREIQKTKAGDTSGFDNSEIRFLLKQLKRSTSSTTWQNRFRWLRTLKVVITAQSGDGLAQAPCLRIDNPYLGEDNKWSMWKYLFESTTIPIRPAELAVQVQGFRCGRYAVDGTKTCVHRCAENIAKAIEERIITLKCEGEGNEQQAFGGTDAGGRSRLKYLYQKVGRIEIEGSNDDGS